MSFIKVSEPILGEREKQLLLECIESGYISSDGPFVRQFESGFSAYIGVKSGVAVSNGTAALEAAFFALDLCEGDEVILPSFTIISCVSALLRFKAIPVLVDIEPITWNIDTTKIEERITSRTKAILAVHMYGHPCDMETILTIAQRANLKVIEDASQVHGAKYKDKYCGSIGDISTFSFYANKIITTGEGGMVLSNDSCLLERARSYRNLCFSKERRFLHYELGNNLRMTNLQAAIGVAQLERLEHIISRKRELGALYGSLLSKIPGVRFQFEFPWARMVYWMYCIELDECTGLSAADVTARLSQCGIETRPFFLGLHQQPVFSNELWNSFKTLPNTERASRQGLYLPSSILLTEPVVYRIVSELQRVLEGNDV